MGKPIREGLLSFIRPRDPEQAQVWVLPEESQLAKRFRKRLDRLREETRQLEEPTTVIDRSSIRDASVSVVAGSISESVALKALEKSSARKTSTGLHQVHSGLASLQQEVESACDHGTRSTEDAEQDLSREKRTIPELGHEKNLRWTWKATFDVLVNLIVVAICIKASILSVDLILSQQLGYVPRKATILGLILTLGASFALSSHMTELSQKANLRLRSWLVGSGLVCLFIGAFSVFVSAVDLSAYAGSTSNLIDQLSGIVGGGSAPTAAPAVWWTGLKTALPWPVVQGVSLALMDIAFLTLVKLKVDAIWKSHAPLWFRPGQRNPDYYEARARVQAWRAELSERSGIRFEIGALLRKTEDEIRQIGERAATRVRFAFGRRLEALRELKRQQKKYEDYLEEDDYRKDDL